MRIARAVDWGIGYSYPGEPTGKVSSQDAGVIALLRSRSRRRFAFAAIAAAVALLAALLIRSYSANQQTNAPALRRSDAAVRALLDRYYNPRLGMLARYPTPYGELYGAVPTGSLRRPPLFESADLWGYSWGLAAVEDVAQLPGGSRYVPVVRSLADHLAEYWDAGAPVPGYAPTPYPGPGNTKFYDDNAWVGLDLVKAYRLTHDPRYLQQAEAVFRYEKTGWDSRRGGIYWNDQRITRNSVSNAPVAELAAYLYMDTHKPEYLSWAKKIYRWQIGHLVDPKTGEVWGRLSASSDVVKYMYTYNQGTVIGAGVLLYEATHRPSYLAQAKKTAAFVLRGAREKNGAFIPPAEFNGVLVENLSLLYSVTHDQAIRAAVLRNAGLAWKLARNDQNLFASDWSGPAPSGTGTELLTQTGAVRLLAVAASLSR